EAPGVHRPLLPGGERRDAGRHHPRGRLVAGGRGRDGGAARGPARRGPVRPAAGPVHRL
ncbi:MAG: hypothetical protein AVDCRST_MAG32-1627, partial [uncultured Nocardioides sp.]